ncbi:hypothetical protein KY308_00035 [Candidatus Woesearchaeota archaeon]|nr:hypothetical protein [Candidatus Woesearchaeota archaeon]
MELPKNYYQDFNNISINLDEAEKLSGQALEKVLAAEKYLNKCLKAVKELPGEEIEKHLEPFQQLMNRIDNCRVHLQAILLKRN